jgi:photosystem II stability/assembly factor-like uncharacterized protein
VLNVNGSKLFHTTNGGIDWFMQNDFGFSSLWNFRFINDSTGFVYLVNNVQAHLIKTIDGGATWQDIFNFNATVQDIEFYNENIGWCAENELGGNLLKTMDGGLNWENLNYFNNNALYLNKIGIINDSSIIITGVNAYADWTIFKTVDGGLNWIEIPTFEQLYGGRIQFINENIGWMRSQNELYKTTDAGFNWQMQVSYLYDFYFINENEGWYVNSNQINKTTDGGLTWISQNSGTNNTLYTINFVDQNNGWVCGDSGIILYTPNGGTPVELTGFKAEVSVNDVSLIWTTSTETNNHGFEIQRKSAKTNWATIGFKEGTGTTTEPQSYSYTDENLSPGKYSYRLKQVDFDGTYKYSDVVDVEVAPSSFSLSQNYPNPFNPTTNIEYRIPNKEYVTLKVFDILGKEVATLVNEEKPAGSNNVRFDGSNLPAGKAGLASGIYFYQIIAGEFTVTKKLIILK